jgi:hypothetical protein
VKSYNLAHLPPEVFTVGMHLEQRARHPFVSGTYGTAWTIRGVEFLAWCLGDRSDLCIAHFARVWYRGSGNQSAYLV